MHAGYMLGIQYIYVYDPMIHVKGSVLSEEETGHLEKTLKIRNQSQRYLYMSFEADELKLNGKIYRYITQVL